MRKILLFCALFVFLLVAASPQELPTPSATDIVDNSIETLTQVEQTLQLYQSNIEQLNKVISSLESDSTASQAELRKQKDLRDSYQSKVKVLSDKYAGLLKISEKLRSSLKVSQSVNVALGVGLLVAIGAIVIQAVIPKK
jgi:peptidoglycan hydrolase CwlO-like protein